jgi:cation:H+ antiporter
MPPAGRFHAGQDGPVSVVAWSLVALAGVGAIVWGAETFAEHLAAASARLGVSAFALTILLAGAEPEELATAVTASLRDAPAIAFGDVIGANVAISLVALGVGAVLTVLPFDAQVRRYALAGLPAGALAAAFAWDGVVSRVEGLVLVAVYVAFVATIWAVERRPPLLGEAAEVEEARAAMAGSEAGRTEAAGVAEADAGGTEPGGTDVSGAGAGTGRGGTGGRGRPARRVGRELALVVAGVAAMAVGATALVEGVRRLTDIESTQLRLGLTVVGFATAFELVVLAWSAARRGITAAVVAGVVGSYTYNATMTLGAGALARPLRVVDAGGLHLPWLAMVGALAVVLALAWPRGRLARAEGLVLLACYPAFVVAVLAA